MYRIQPAFQNYEWGTSDYIPDLFGFEPNGHPYAEAWLGAHPKAPATTLDGTPITAILDSNSLPFLMKVLSIKKPLSIQVHPNKAQAEAGFRHEHAARIPIDSPLRNYRDPNHKPETIVAIGSGLEARAGIREDDELDALMYSLGSCAMIELWESDEVQASPVDFIRALSDIGSDMVDTMIGQALTGSIYPRFNQLFPHDRIWLENCAYYYPGDTGVITQLLLNYVRLQPGEGLHMLAGEPHSYLHGAGIEIMANSDNVIRVGLTPKHMDIDELVSIGNFDPSPPRLVPAESGQQVYDPGLPDYKLMRTQETNGTILSNGPAITLCTEGCVELSGTSGCTFLKAGQAALSFTEELFVNSNSGTTFTSVVGD